MNAQPPPIAKTHGAQLSYAQAAARASWVGCVIVLLLLAFGRGAIPVLELVAFGLLAFAVVCGLVAFTGIPQYGCKGILAPALAGLTMAGLFLFIGITNFVQARARQVALRTNSQNPTTRPILPYLSKYSRGKLRFTYDGRYTISQEDTDQIALKHTESEVMIYPFNTGIDVDEQVKTAANEVRARYQANNMTDIRETPIEQLHTSTMSGAKTAAKMQLTCKARHGQVVTEFVAISGETDSVLLMHVYAQSQPALAAKMFETVLNSFLN